MSILFDQQETDSDHLALELFFADGSVTEEDGLVWKEVLREDQWAYRPGPGQKPVSVPLKVVAGHTNEEGQIGMDDLVTAFNEGAVDHVTVPTSHTDKPHENTGFVRKLKKTSGKDGKARLLAGIEFTEEDIKGKATRGTIANTSVGVLFNYVKKDTGKRYNQVLGHVALTNKPWINGMQPFGVAASEDYADDEIVPLVLASVVWQNKNSFAWLREQVQNALPGGDADLSPFFVHDISKNKALVSKFDANGGTESNFVVPFSVQDDNVTVANQEDWVEANREWIKASEELMKNFSKENFDSAESTDESLSESANSGAEETSQEIGDINMAETKQEIETTTGESPSEVPAPEVSLSAEDIEKFRNEFEETQTTLSDENKKLRAQVHALNVDKKVEQYKADFGESQPGLLKEVRNIMLADSGESVLTLSETSEDNQTTEVSLTATQIVERVLSALPKKDGMTLLGEQHLSVDDKDAPPVEVESDSTNLSQEQVKERADKIVEELGLGDEYRSKDGDA